MSFLGPLSIHWRTALDAAEDALDAAARSGTAVRFPAEELRRRGHKLAVERAETQVILEALAHETRSHLTRRMTGPRATAELIGLDHAVHACDSISTAC